MQVPCITSATLFQALKQLWQVTADLSVSCDMVQEILLLHHLTIKGYCDRSNTVSFCRTKRKINI